MKKICYSLGFFVLVVLLAACSSDTNDNAAEGSTPTAAEVEEMKKTDLKAYNRTKYEKIVTGFQSPESVITDGTHFYVSNVGAALAPSTKDADGFISKLDTEGNILELKWISGDDLHAPKGMAIVKGVLYVADIDKVRGFDMNSKEKVFQLDFSPTGTAFLNDLAVRDHQTMYVSSTDLGYIYKIDLQGNGKYEIVDIYSDLSGANGLVYDEENDRLLISSYGLDGAPTGMVGVCPMNVKKLKQKTIGTFHGYLDGLQLVADDMVLVTDWQDFEKGGNLLFYDLKTEKLQPLLGGLIGGPADFYYDGTTKKVWLPAMADNELIITPLALNLERDDNVILNEGGYEVKRVE